MPIDDSKRWRNGAGLGLAAFLCMFGATAQGGAGGIETDCAEEANLILANATVITMNPQQPAAESLAVCRNRILAVGSDAEVEQYRGADTEYVDLGGQLVLPGFVDTHSHFSSDLMLPTFPTVEFREGMSVDEVLRAIEAFLVENPDVPMLIGYQFDISAVVNTEQQQVPTVELLDSVVPDRPAVLLELGGHSLWFNSAARDEAGLNRDTPDPIPGSHFFVRDEQGVPSGWAYESAMDPLVGLIDSFRSERSEEIPESFRLATEQGITTYFDAHTVSGERTEGFEEPLLRLAELEKRGKLPFRVLTSVGVFTIEDAEQALETYSQLQPKYRSDMLRMGILKLHVDPQWDQAVLWEGLNTEPGVLFSLPLGLDRFTRLVFEADKAKIDMHFHVMGDRATSEAIDAIEQARGINGDWGARHTLAHIAMIKSRDIVRMKDLGILASLTLNWGRFRAARVAYLGKQRFWERGTYPIGLIVRSGVRTVYGADYPVYGTEWISPIRNIEAGFTRKTPGEPESTVGPRIEDRISRMEPALRGYTIDAAYMLRLEDQIGSLEAGKLADIIVVDKNLFKLPVEQIHTASVVRTILDGKTIFRRDVREGLSQ